MVLAPLIRAALSFGFCNILKAENRRNDTFRRVIPGTDPNFGYRGRALYAQYCDEPPEFSDPPFSGGQCEYCYTVSVTRTILDPVFPQLSGTATISQTLYGELSYVGLSELPSPPSNSRWQARFSSYGSCSQARLSSPVILPITDDVTSDQATYTVDNITVTPVGGLPDDCGNPPIEPPPEDPAGRQFPINITINYDDGTDLDFIGNVFFGFAYFDNDFDLNVPINIKLNNNVNFVGNFNFDTGDFVINWGDEFDYPKPPPPEGDYNVDPDQPLPPPTTVPPPPDYVPPFPPNPDPDPQDPEDFPDDVPPEAPKIRRMIGVLVDSATTPPLSTELGQNVNPDVYIPDIGLVNFAYNIGGTRLYWGEDIRVKNKRQVIFTPSGRYAVAVSGTPRQGASWTLTPIYAEVPQTVGVT